jgi:hypothetical protein
MSLRILSLAFVTALAAVVGCSPQAEIAHYSVPKEVVPKETQRQIVPASTPGEATDRMLAAVLPDGDRAWFFKVTGPIAAVEAQSKAIADFFGSVRVAPGKPHPNWTLPAGWQAQAGSGMRAATILVAGTPPMEMSVTALPWQGAPGELLSNVNRWRGQMQLPPTDESGLADCTRELKAGDATLTVVDLSGQFQNTMTPPFAGGAGGAPPFAGGAATPPAASSATGNAPAGAAPVETQNQSALPPGHPPIQGQGVMQGQGMMALPAAAQTAAPFKFELPAGWEQRPASGMRKAEFRISRDGKTATLTAIDFPADAGPMMADPIANVKRWRGEIGLPDLSNEELAKTIEAIQVGSADAKFVSAIPDPSQANQSQAQEGTLAAMVTHGNTIWFLKLRGDRELVASERDNFKKFLASVEFDGAGGAK